MRCGYVSLKSGRQVHYRTAGEGPPLIILHPSPQSSAAMASAINAFSSVCTCFALDTPGYGFSDPMEQDVPTMGDYAEVLDEAAQALGFDRYFVYGAATGSQFAIEMAKRYPDRVRFVMLDSNGHISDEMCERLVTDGYFADTSPRRDGGHLLTYWDMCRHLFYVFPWNSGREDERLGFDLPPASVTHDIFLRYLQAGEDYHTAYKAALYTERRSHLDGMTTPGVMTRWLDSVVLNVADDLINLGLPENVRVLEAGHGVEARFSVQVDALRAMIAEEGLLNVSADIKGVRDASRFRRAYFDADIGQLHAWVNDIEDAAPVVLLHGAAQSAARVKHHAQKFAEKRKVIAIDLPGHGGSLDLPDDQAITMSALAAPIAKALQVLGVKEIDVIGVGFGAAVGVEIGKILTVRRLKVVDPIPYTSEEAAGAIEQELPDLSPRDDGAHLVSAWAIVRDAELFWPFWDHRASAGRKGDANLSPSYLHERVVDVLRVGARWNELTRREITLDWREYLEKGCFDNIVLELSDNHPCPKRVTEVFSNAL